VAACGVGAFVVTIPLTTFGVFLPVLTNQFGWSRGEASTAYGALTIGAALWAPIWGTVLDRVGARPVVLGCLALSGLAVASLSALMSSLFQFRAVFAVIGLAMMGASPIAYSRAIFGWFDERRGRALGVMLTGAAMSGIVLPPVAQGLIRAFNWRIAWLVLGATTLLVALPIAMAFLRDRHTAESGRAGPSSASAAKQAFRSRALWTLLIVAFGGSVATNGAIVHMVALLTDRGVPGTQAALTLSAMGAASLIGRLLTGVLLDRFAAVRVSVSLLSIAAVGAFVLAGAHSIGAGLIAAVCLGFGSGGETDVIPYLLSRYFGLRVLSTLYGLHWTAWGIAGAVGPILLGRAFDATGSYGAALTGMGVITLAAAVLMFTFPLVPRRAQR
jgi:MFS family permease